MVGNPVIGITNHLKIGETFVKSIKIDETKFTFNRFIFR